MKLLFDENLSHRLAALLTDLFPGSVHVRDLGLQRAGDGSIWEMAKREGLVIVSKDDDFHQRSFLEGPPPKVIGILLGNSSTQQVEQLLRWRYQLILQFAADEKASFLPLR